MSLTEPQVKLPDIFHPTYIFDDISQRRVISFSPEQEEWLNERRTMIKNVLKLLGMFYKKNSNLTYFTKGVLEINYNGTNYIIDWHLHHMIKDKFFAGININNQFYKFKSCQDFYTNLRTVLETQ